MRSNYILSIEDDAVDIALMQRIFEKKLPGYSVKHITDGQRAIEFLESEEFKEELPRLILLDIKIPKYNGLEILKKIRAYKEFKNIPVVMLSSSDRADEIEEAYQLGANSYVEKPKTFLGLCKAIPTLIDYWIVYNK